MSFQRPVMDITYLNDADVGEQSPPARMKALRALWRMVVRTAKLAAGVLTYRPFGRSRLARFRNDDGTPASRFVRGALYRLAFVPIVIVTAACAMVYSGTHPIIATSDVDPNSLGIYYEPISFRSGDGQRIDAWLIPALDAQTVLDQEDRALRQRHPAVVLLHDFGSSRQQLLPLIRPLHEAGFILIVPALRGGGSAQPSGQTFGLRETLDVKAAVELLRKLAFVDPQRIALIGIGSGANAALLASAADASLGTLVLEAPIADIDEFISRYVSPKSSLMRWIQPLCKWTFEIAYEVDGQELSSSRYASVLSTRSVLVLECAPVGKDVASPRHAEQIRIFLSKRLADSIPPSPHKKLTRR